MLSSLGNFNWVDGIIVLLIVGAAVRGLKIGFSNLVFVVTGFFGGLFLGGTLFPHLLPVHDRTLKTIINANLVLLLALYAAVRGWDLAQHIHRTVRRKSRDTNRLLQRLDAGGGTLAAALAAWIFLWLLGVGIARLPFAGFSNSVGDAGIMQAMVHTLPPVPAVFAEFDRQVNPNAPPQLREQPKPQTSFAYSLPEVQQAVAKASASVVRVTSFGCGGVVSGSGFVADRGLVITNAHVIAGVKRPIIKYRGRSYAAVPVLFNASLDLAALRVDGFSAPSLPLLKQDAGIGTTVAALGYPGGEFRASPGLIRNSFIIYGANIYGLGDLGRAVYEVQTDISEGASGGPLVTADGQVVGVIFGASLTTPHDAYALASPHLLDLINQAKRSYRRVSTNGCLAG